MEPSITWSLLARYFAGETTPEEAREVEGWATESSSNARLMDELRDVWQASSSTPAPPPVDLDAEWEQLVGRVEAGEASVAARADRPPAASRPSRRVVERAPRLPHRSAPNGWIAALALVVCVLCGALLAEWWTATEPETVLREVITRRGERAHLRLADGTQVTLNVDSKLQLPATLAAGRRHVQLTGEAYFDVAHDPDRPFVVQVGHAVVDVHGTSFGVRSYPDDRRVQVAVTDGLVALRGQQEPERAATVLEPGQLGQLRAGTRTVEAEEVDVQDYVGWREGRLVFDDTPLPEVAAQLERWYDLQVVLQQQNLDSLRLTANLKSKSVRDVLDVITAALGIRYRLTGDTLLLLTER